MTSKQHFSTKIDLANIVSYMTLLAVGLMGVFMLEPGVQRLVGSGLLVIFGVIFWFSPDKDAPDWIKHAYFIVQSFVVCSLMMMHPSWGPFPILFFILSAHATMLFPQRMGYIWVGLFTLFTGIVMVSLDTSLEGFLSLLPFAAGYWFFAAFSTIMAAANEARQESQTLLDELQLAHHQLQEYAAQVEELAVSEERNRLAREMHDTLGHRLTVAAVQLEGAQRLIPVEPDRATEMVSTVREEVREALSELRRTVATLREPLQMDISLPHALGRLVASFEKATGLDVHLTIPQAELLLPNPHRLALYRAVQEGLTNVQRHAQAKNVWILLKNTPQQVTLLISDDGIGYDEKDETPGFGLRGLRERVSQVKGTLQIESRPEGGTQLRIVLPISMENNDE